MVFKYQNNDDTSSDCDYQKKMATKIDSQTWLNVIGKVIVFDLEFVGDITKPETCHLWEIGATYLSCSKSFTIVIDPQVQELPPAIDGCFPLTNEFLEDHGTSLENGLNKFKEWVGASAIMVSHNCFKSDMGVLRGAFKKCNIDFPSWLFVDSLLLIRQHVKLNNYKLSNTYQHFMRSPLRNAHRALSDAESLKHIMISMGPLCQPTFAYPLELTPLQCIGGIGRACESVLVWKQIRSVESLVLYILNSQSSMLLHSSVTFATVAAIMISQLELPVASCKTIIDNIILWRQMHQRD